MAITSSGQIKLTDIQTEFGGSAPTALSEYYSGGANVAAGTESGGGVAIPSSGEIQLSDFYGSSAFSPYNITYLAVAGGASGGRSPSGDGSGGGGAGGMLTGVLQASGSDAAFPRDEVVTVSIGGGGSAQGSNAQGNNGSATTIEGSYFTNISSTGGGGGGSHSTSSSSTIDNGHSGGSGGGGGAPGDDQA